MPNDNPSRYNHGDIECIDAIRSALSPTEFRGFCKGSMIRYVWREAYKGGDVDLGKAKDYAEYAILAPDAVSVSMVDALYDLADTLDKACVHSCSAKTCPLFKYMDPACPSCMYCISDNISKAIRDILKGE